MTADINRKAFALAIEAKRIHRGLSIGEAARQAGVTPPAFGWARSGLPIRRGNFIKLCTWAGEDPATFITGGENG